MSFYNELHAGNIPGAEEESDVKHSEDNSGIQPHSKGDLYPWVWTCQENFKTNSGQYYYQHPDGRVSPKAVYNLDASDATKHNAYRAAAEAVRSLVDQDNAEREWNNQRRRDQFNLGDKLPNGATVIEHEGVIVLAAKCDANGRAVEYVTWCVDNKGNANAGHYFSKIGNAVADYNERLKTWYPNR